tara:strand:- start:205 stop:399 length:195 start_codon:yes stop_codon:yes gene_type:complete
MTAIIWALVLTACTSSGECYNQTIQWFDGEPECLEIKAIHESIPPDDSWKTVDYTCKIIGAVGI